PYYLMPYGVGALIYAPLTRFVTYRVVMVSTMVLFAATCFVCGSAQSLGYILGARVLMGITASSAIPLGLMIIGELFEKNIRGRLVGGFFSCAFIASLAGIALSGVVNWRWLFYAPAILAVILAFGFMVFGLGHLSRVHVGHVNYLRALRNIKIRNVFIFIFMISFLYHGVHKWYGIYLSRFYQFTQFQISIYFILSALGGIFGQLIGGVLSDKKGRMVSCRVGILGLSLGVMLLVGTYPSILLGLIFMLISTCWTIGHNGLSTVLTDFPDNDRPMIASLNSSVRFISGGLGFCVSAFFVEKNFGLTFFVIGVLMLLLSFGLKRIIVEH
ncbi:MAG: MFS transporter, partial [Candidatus Omnitrophica bacterium]|nr:MFS transporter [Candidatus Omnitrophota bacterium]